MPADAGITIHESRLLRTFGAPAIVASIRNPRYRALLSADADGTLVNRPRKTNATFGGACFSFGLDYIIAPWFFGLDQVSKSDIV